jgi:hypothetical protein
MDEAHGMEGPRRRCSSSAATTRNRLRAGGYNARDEDMARLSPLGHEHINRLGRHAFAPPDAVARGGLRSLQDPATADNEASIDASILRLPEARYPQPPRPAGTSAPGAVPTAPPDKGRPAQAIRI